MNLLRSTGIQGLLAAVLLHGVALAGLFTVSIDKRATQKRRPPVKIRVAKRPDPPPPAPEPEPVPKPEPERPKPKPLPKKKPEPEKPRPPPPPAPPPAPEPPPAPKTPRRFTVAMEATVSTGGTAVPATATGGTWAPGTPDGDPDGEKTLPVAVQASETTALPKLISQPTAKTMRAIYPEAARRDGIEGNVSLKILVSAEGRVARVKILRRAGNGFDEVAVKLVKRFRFRPGEKNGEPVAVWIPWTYKFRLDG